MKKLLAVLLLCAMCVAMFAACGGTEGTDTTTAADNGEQTPGGTTPDATLADAKTYLDNLYKKDNGKKTTGDWEVVKQVMVAGVAFPITWTVDNADITIKDNAAGTMKVIDLPETAVTEDVTYTLTATIKDSKGNSTTVTYTRVLPASEDTSYIVSAPVEGVAYKFFIEQNAVAKLIYATADIDSGKRLNGTEDPAAALDFYAEVVDGGYKFYATTVDGAKKYLHGSAILESGKKNPTTYLELADSTDNVYTYNSTIHAWCVMLDSATYIFGTHSEYTTFSFSSDYYYQDPSVSGTSQFPANLALKEDALNGNVGNVEDVVIYETPAEILAAAYALKDNAYLSGSHKYTLTGVISKVDYEYSEENGDITVTMIVDNLTDYPIQAYRLTGVGVEALKEGDTVTVKGPIQKYVDKDGNVKVEIVEGTIVVDETPAGTITIPEFVALGSAQAHDTYTTNKYTITGTVTEIKNQKYGNMIIEDAEGNSVLIYGVYDATGATLYENMTKKPAVGDTITVIGVAGQFNGTAQMKNGWVLSINDESIAPDPDEPTPPESGNDELIVSAPVADVAYKLFLAQNSLGQTLYAGASLSNNKYLTGETDAANGYDFYAEIVDGGYKFYTMIDGTKMYLNAELILEDGETYPSKYLNYKAETTNVWYYKSDVKAWFVTLDGSEYVLGTYNSFDTFCISQASHITTETTGKTQFPGNLILKDDAGNAQPDIPAVPTEETSIPDFKAIASAQPDKGDTTIEKYLVTGTITEIVQTTYGNVYIEDADGNRLYIYGLLDADGTNKFETMNPQPKVGDTITVLGVASNYDGPQMNNGWVQELVAGDYVPPVDTSAATMEFKDPTNRTVGTNTQQVWVVDGITVTSDKAGSQTNIRINDDDGHIRCYQNSNLTIAYTSAMTKIVITCTSDSYANALATTAISVGTVTVDGTTVTITFDTAVDSVVFTDMKAQSRISMVKVYVD